MDTRVEGTEERVPLGRHRRQQQLGVTLTLDVIAKNLAVTLGAALSETLSTLSTSRHIAVLV